MITIAGITLPLTAIWANETEYGLPETATESDLSGMDMVFTGQDKNNIEIYIPATESGITRENVIALCRAAANGAPVTAQLNDRTLNVMFASGSGAIELKPLNAKQEQTDTDIYSGTIRLLEV
jgi:hypothetical protein